MQMLSRASFLIACTFAAVLSFGAPLRSQTDVSVSVVPDGIPMVGESTSLDRFLEVNSGTRVGIAGWQIECAGCTIQSFEFNYIFGTLVDWGGFNIQDPLIDPLATDGTITDLIGAFSFTAPFNEAVALIGTVTVFVDEPGAIVSPVEVPGGSFSWSGVPIVDPIQYISAILAPARPRRRLRSRWRWHAR